MKRLMCLICLVLILPGLSYAQSETGLKANMLTEIVFVRRILQSVNEELLKTKNFLNESLKKNSEDSKSTKAEIESLESEKLVIEKRLSLLERDYKLLSDSKDSWARLNENYDDEIKILEGQVRTWRAVGVVSIAILIGGAVYMATR